MKQSAGLLMYRRRGGDIEILLVHPGGPLFLGKDEGVWTIPKGEIDSGDEPFDVARREFEEETGQSVASCASGMSLAGSAEFVPLGTIRQKSGKIVEAWAFEGDWPEGAVLTSNLFTLEWPPRSGRRVEFPEVDRGEFFTPAQARVKVNPAQAAFIDRLLASLEGR